MSTRAESRRPAALGDDTRLQILARLSSHGPSSLSGLTEGSGVTRQAVAKHLRVLAVAGLVRGNRSGRQTRWRLERRGLEDARRSLDQVSRQWEQGLSKLKQFLER